MADKTYTVEEFKLACISDDVLTDVQVQVLMQNVMLNSEEDVEEFVGILFKYRPALAKRFFSRPVMNSNNPSGIRYCPECGINATRGTQKFCYGCR